MEVDTKCLDLHAFCVPTRQCPSHIGISPTRWTGWLVLWTWARPSCYCLCNRSMLHHHFHPCYHTMGGLKSINYPSRHWCSYYHCWMANLPTAETDVETLTWHYCSRNYTSISSHLTWNSSGSFQSALDNTFLSFPQCLQQRHHLRPAMSFCCYYITQILPWSEGPILQQRQYDDGHVTRLRCLIIWHITLKYSG